MDRKKLNPVRQIEIAKPCPEDWDAMQGDSRQRFCAGCGCFVHNISAMGAEQAEELLLRPERVCARIVSDQKQGILTRDGWIPRLMLAGAVAASVAGCSEPTQPLTGSTAPPPTEVKSNQQIRMGDFSLVNLLEQKKKEAEANRTIGKISTPQPKKKK